MCTFVRLRGCGWEDLRDGCAAFLVFRVGSARTLMGKGAPYDGGGALVVRHRGGHTPWRSHPCLIGLSLRKRTKRSSLRPRAASSVPWLPEEQCCARGQWEAIVDHETWCRSRNSRHHRARHEHLGLDQAQAPGFGPVPLCSVWLQGDGGTARIPLCGACEANR